MLSTGLSTISLIVAAAALWISSRNLKVPARRLHDIDLALGDIEHDINSLRSTSKRINARVGMREAREKLNAETDEAERELPSAASDLAPLPGESDLEWKRRARVALQTRGLNHGR